ncbi:MAG: M48 family metallopeptidase [Desulfobacula sp.]|nr:M48 family metallopeptidase [Desulfobacula sp.]
MKVPFFDFGSFHVEIVQKRIKNIYFRVYPLKKTILVSAPAQLDPETLNQAILSKRDWILRQVNKRTARQPSPEKTYTTGEGFLFQGKAYHLSVLEQEQGKPACIFSQDHIQLTVKPGSTLLDRQSLIDGWCRKEMRQSVFLFLEKWEPLIGVKIRQFGVRKMKTRWGSCNITAARIWLNLSLIHFPPRFLEYVTVHEMVHLLERGHNARFKGFMDRFIPDWRDLKKELGRFNL